MDILSLFLLGTRQRMPIENPFRVPLRLQARGGKKAFADVIPFRGEEQKCGPSFVARDG